MNDRTHDFALEKSLYEAPDESDPAADFERECTRADLEEDSDVDDELAEREPERT